MTHIERSVWIDNNVVHGSFMSFVYWVEPKDTGSWELTLTRGSGHPEKKLYFDFLEEAMAFVKEYSEQMKTEADFEAQFNTDFKELLDDWNYRK